MMKKFKLVHVAESFPTTRQIKVSEDLAVHLWPSLEKLAKLRDTFARLYFGYGKHEASRIDCWRRMFNESELLLENHHDFSI